MKILELQFSWKVFKSEIVKNIKHATIIRSTVYNV